MSNNEFKLEIEKEKTKQLKEKRTIEAIKDSRWGKYGVIGGMLILMTGILIALLVS